MNRRSTALWVALVCLLALLGVALLAPMPYVLLFPGPTENTLGAKDGKQVVEISGHRTYPTTGQLRLTTVSETSADYSVRLPQVIRAWVSPDEIVVPRDVIYDPSQSIQQVQKQNTQEMLDSQSTAKVAGLAQAGIDALEVTIAKVYPNTPADGVLRKGDQIASVNGTQVNALQDVAAMIGPLAPGTSVRIGIVRGATPRTVTLQTQQSPDDPNKSRVGVELTDTYDPPFTISINLGQRIGGPSAGMIFALAIYDKLTPGPLAGGRNIAGTGTIDVEGNVGPIGGIQQKLVGAYDAGARVFLAPAADCAEALQSSVADKMDLVRVATLDQAVRALRALDAGRERAVPRCGS